MSKKNAITIISILAVLVIGIGVLYLTNNSKQEKKIIDLSQDVSNCNSQIDKLNADIANKDGQIETLTVDITDKNSQIETLSTDVADKTGQIDILTADIADKAGQIESLTADVADKAGQIESLTADVADKAGQIETLTADVANKADQIKNLSSDLEKKEQQIITLNDDAKVRKEEIITLNADNVDQAAQIKALTKEIEDKDAQISNLSVSLEEEQKKNRELSASIQSQETRVSYSEMTEKELMEVVKEIAPRFDALNYSLTVTPKAEKSKEEATISSGNKYDGLASSLPEAYPVGSPASADDFTYVSNGEAVQINGYKGTGGYVIIPDTIEGLPVTKIARAAFEKNNNITGISLPKHLTEIGSSAFSSMSKLTGVLVIPDGVTKVDHYAFMWDNLTGLVIKSDCYCGVDSFAFNDNLDFLYVKEGCNPRFDGSALAGDKLTTVILPSSLDRKIDPSDNFTSRCNKDTVIYTPANSYAESYAKEHFVMVNNEDYEAISKQYAEAYD